MLYLSEGGPEIELSPSDLVNFTHQALEKLGNRKKVLLLPPDYTRYYSQAGIITAAACNFYRSKVKDIMPATGTHMPMTHTEIKGMFPGVPEKLFREHNWRSGLKTIGNVPAGFISDTFGFKVEQDWPAQINRIFVDGGYDLILSIGQVVPHEIVGMANYNKNIFIGAGGTEAINQSHYLGAVYGMERIMGRTDTPVRRILNYASDNFSSSMPIVYVQTVVSSGTDGNPIVKGIFIGDDIECFEKAAELSRAVNITYLDKRVKRVVVQLPESNKSMWLGNKAVYRSRMAIENNGDLIVMAPGIRQFGEDSDIDQIIRKYGYRGTETTIDAVKKHSDIGNNLSAAAHLIHGSSEGRFNIIYSPGGLTRKEVEDAGYSWLATDETNTRFSPDTRHPGFNVDVYGEEFFLIKNAAIGLWTAGALS